MTFEWYAARAGGIVAFALLTLAVVVGLSLSGRARIDGWPRFAVEEVHRYVGVLAGVFVALHGLALLLDRYVPFSLAELVVPGTASYRPFATALGVVAAELLLAVAVTNHYRRRLPHRFWRRAHYATFAVWALSLVHGILAGSDTNAWWAAWLYGSSGATVAALTAWRVATTAHGRRAKRRRPTGAALPSP